jgi:hypothetical protein
MAEASMECSNGFPLKIPHAAARSGNCGLKFHIPAFFIQCRDGLMSLNVLASLQAGLVLKLLPTTIPMTLPMMAPATNSENQ